MLYIGWERSSHGRERSFIYLLGLEMEHARKFVFCSVLIWISTDIDIVVSQPYPVRLIVSMAYKPADAVLL